MSPSGLHSLFESLAWAAALAVGWWTRRHEFAAVPLPMAGRRYPVYLLVLWLGAVAGAYGLGSLNVALAGVAGEGRSILGAIVGGVIAAEIYKGVFGISGSTGAVLVLPLAVAIAIGRIGCFLAGLPDYTYGTPSDLPWGVDFGDGIPRHPVQLYESITMALFALGFFLWLRRGRSRRPAMASISSSDSMALQRFLWEFLKPYPAVVGPFNVFHLAAWALVIYAAVMMRSRGPSMRSLKPYIFYGQTTSLCETCLRAGAGQDPDRGRRRLLPEALPRAWRAEDADLHRCGLLPELPGLSEARRHAAQAFQSRTHYGCPYDCGLCPDHEQHSCLALIEINEACNLTCPVCFAEFGAARGRAIAAWPRSSAMLETLVASEGEPDLVQISGGEPTHPSRRSSRSCSWRSSEADPPLMLNTNGVRIARDEPAFVAKLWPS